MKALKNEVTTYVEEIINQLKFLCENETLSNRSIIERYSMIGRAICEQGEKAFVVYIADMIAKNFPELKGFSPRNLRRMRDFYKTYEESPSLMKKAMSLTWTQNTVILECCDNNEQRSFYLSLAKKNNLSKLALLKSIKCGLFNANSVEEIQSNIETDCSHLSGEVTTSTSNNSITPTKKDCRAFVTVSSPFRQGIGVGKIRHRAFKYIKRLKIDLWCMKMIYYEKIRQTLCQSAEFLKQIVLQRIKHQYSP